MTGQAVYYSWAWPGGRTIADAGYVGALRYLGDTSRDLSAAELAELHAAGLAVAIIWETVADRAGHGYAAGAADAGRANWYADRLGWPAGRPIFYAVDFDGTPEQVAPYFDGVRSVPGRPVGIYGSYRIIEAFAGLPFRWQCAAWSGNGQGTGGSIGGRRLSAHAHLFQRVGYVLNDTCDANDLLAADWGGWHPDNPTEGDDDMATLARAITGKDDPTEDELRDGLGRLVLFHVSGQARGEAIARGEAVNTGNHLPWTTLADLVSDADALQLAVNTVSANRAAIVEALADLPLGDGVDAGDVAEAVVAALGAKLTQAG